MKKVFWLQARLQSGKRVGLVDRVVMTHTGGVKKLPSLLFNRPFTNPCTTNPSNGGVASIRREYNGTVTISNKLFTIVEVDSE